MKKYAMTIDVEGGKVLLFLRYFKLGRVREEIPEYTRTAYMAGIGKYEFIFTSLRRNNERKTKSKHQNRTASA